MKLLCLLFLICSSVYAIDEESERREKERILREYGNQKQLEAEAEEPAVDLNEAIRALESQPLVSQEEQATLSPQELEQLKLKRQRLRESQLRLWQDQASASQKSLNDEAEDFLEDPSQQREQLQKQISNLMGKKGMDNNFLTNMMDQQMKQEMAKLMKSNPLSQLSKADLRAKIEQNSQGTPLGKFLAKSPKLKELMVELAHDKDALPGFIGIVNKPAQMKTYGICVLVVFIAAFIFNVFNTKGSLIKRLFLKLILTLGTLVANVGIFYFLFQKELDPTVRVLKRVLL